MQRITNSKVLIAAEGEVPRASSAAGRTLPHFTWCLEQIVKSRGAFVDDGARRELEVFGRVGASDDSEGRDGDLALVLSSSGSSGVPKGVALSHKNVITALHARFATLPQKVG
jgi:long-subunit acyl-CoA synthetase (AMP-forming)